MCPAVYDTPALLRPSSTKSLHLNSTNSIFCLALPMRTHRRDPRFFRPNPQIRKTFLHTACIVLSDQAHLAHCNYLHALHDITNLCRSDLFVQASLRLFSFNPQAGLIFYKSDNQRFHASSIFNFRNPGHDYPNNLYDYLAVPRLPPRTLHSQARQALQVSTLFRDFKFIFPLSAPALRSRHLSTF